MPKRRANGEGSLFFDDKKKIYRAMITTPAGKRLTKSSKDESIIRDWLNEQRLLLGRNQTIEPNTLTLHQWIYTWVETYSKPKTRQRTYERNLSLINHIEPLWNLPLQKILPNQLQSLYNTMHEDGYSGETIKKVHQLLNSSLKRAVIDRLIMTNPAALLDTPKVTREEIEAFTEQEVELLLATAKDHKFYPLLLLAFTSGMRLGELLGLRWEDIDFNNNQIFVRQTLQSTNQKGIIFEPPKTKNSKRKITVPVQTISALKKQKKIWLENRLKNPHEYTLAFISEKGTPLSPQNFLRRFWKRLQIDAEFNLNNHYVNPSSVKKKLDDILQDCRQKSNWRIFEEKNFHVIRHTYATTLLGAGVPIIDVSRALGHARASTTIDIYGHAIPENKKIIADKIAGAFLK